MCAGRWNTPQFEAWNSGFHGKTWDEQARSHARNLMSWHNQRPIWSFSGDQLSRSRKWPTGWPTTNFADASPLLSDSVDNATIRSRNVKTIRRVFTRAYGPRLCGKLTDWLTDSMRKGLQQLVSCRDREQDLYLLRGLDIFGDKGACTTIRR